MSPERTPPGLAPVRRTRRQARDYYDLLSRRYDRLAGRAERPGREAGLRLLDAREGERILEVGFGTGQALVRLARAVGVTGRVHGLDLSDGMLEVAKERLWREGLAGSAELRLGDGTSLPYLPGVFDAVFLAFTLELFDTPEIPLVLGECRRVLREGGRIVVVALAKEAPPAASTVRKFVAGAAVGLYEWAHRLAPVRVDCRPIRPAQALWAAGFTLQGEPARLWMWGLPVEAVLATRRP